MSDVERFDLTQGTNWECYGEMIPVTDGDWIRASDYDALKARLEAAVEALRLFLEDPRFDVMVGGNPIAVQKMYEQAQAVLKERP